MGEVYAAQDSKLGRKVALKVLPPEMADNPERRARFEREARAVAALNHPNIVTIHSVEEAEGVHFLTMELVDGQPLSALIPSQGMPLSELLKRGVAMADALSAAHALGITHRDLKPDNIMISTDGRLKILDFGLAKLREDAGSTAEATSLPTRSVTAEGKIVGTVAYMSPEQAEGKKVDERSDVFSMGIVLYQMATGRRPFDGDTPISTLSAILKDSPPSVTEINQSLPRHLGRVISYCLAKDPAQRYQSAMELRRELEGLREESQSGEFMPAVARKPVLPLRWLGLAVGAVGLILVVLLAMKFLPGDGKSGGRGSAGAATPSSAAMEMTRLTSSGHASEAAISPDGHYVAFVERQPHQALWVSHVSTGSKVQVVAPSRTFFIWDPAFAPQSDYVYYCGREQGGGFAGLYRVPVLGGTPRKVADHVAERISFSPDGQRIVFTRREPGLTSLVTSNVDGSEQEVITTHRFPDDLGDASWSPDGNTIAASTSTFKGGPQENVLLVSSDGGGEKLLFDEGWSNISEVAWLSDGTGLVFEGFKDVGFFTGQIWEASFPGGIARRITNDLNLYGGLAIDGTGNRIVTTQRDVEFDLWVTTPGDSTAPVQLTRTRGARESVGLDWTPDGRVVYGASVGQQVNIWTIDADGKNADLVISNDWYDAEPRATADGRYLVFLSNRAGSINLWRSNLDGSDPQQLTRGLADWDPATTPDGQWVLYIGGDERNAMKVSIDGGEPVKLNSQRSGGPVASPDGKWIAVETWDDEEVRWGVDITPMDGGERRQRMRFPGWDEFQWSPDSRSLTVDVFEDGTENLFDYPLDGGERRQLTHFTEGFIGTFAWSPDGTQIVLSRGKSETDIVLLSNFR